MAATEDGPLGENGSTTGDRDVPRIREITAQLLRVLPVDGVAVGVRAGPDTAQLIHATDPVAAGLDEAQFTLGEGPASTPTSAGTRCWSPT